MNPYERGHGLAAFLRCVVVLGTGLFLQGVAADTALGQSFQVAEECATPGELGTFTPTPYIMVGGAAPTSAGYSPLGLFGDTSMSLNGPFSALRSISAPVMTYNRGYDGVVRAVPATSSSNPNLPILSPVIYPTQRSYYYAPRVNRTPPWWSSGVNWIDQQ